MRLRWRVLSGLTCLAPFSLAVLVFQVLDCLGFGHSL